MSSGRLVIEKDSGSRTGFYMSGGSIVVHGSVGNFSGSNMSGGTLLDKGDAGSNLGTSMVGGTIILMGSADPELGSNMSGGVIVVCGKHHHTDNSVMKYGRLSDIPKEALDLHPLSALKYLHRQLFSSMQRTLPRTNYQCLKEDKISLGSASLHQARAEMIPTFPQIYPRG